MENTGRTIRQMNIYVDLTPACLVWLDIVSIASETNEWERGSAIDIFIMAKAFL